MARGLFILDAYSDHARLYCRRQAFLRKVVRVENCPNMPSNAPKDTAASPSAGGYRGPEFLPRILVLESDPETARRLINAIAASRVECNDPGPPCDENVSPAEAMAGASIVQSIGDLMGMNLSSFGACIAATALCDAVGPDILALLASIAPDLPVVVVGPTADLCMAPEFIRAGAADVLVLTGHELVTVPLALHKALALAQLRAENEALHTNLGRTAGELAEANSRLEGTIKRLEVAVRTDELTGLMNRRWLDLTLEARWVEACRHDQDLGLIMIDLDGFKQLNDRYGHQAGDDVLRLVGSVLRDSHREIDTAARYGGDEFCVLAPHADLQATMTLANRMLIAFQAALVVRDLAEIVDMSIGVACRSVSRPDCAQDLLLHADKAMYTAKSGPGNIALHARSQDGWQIAG